MTNSNESDQANKRDRAFVTLALGIKGQDPKDLPSVSDDDLLALHQGQLSVDHKARVMHSIANNSDTYHRWIELVKTMDLVDELEIEDRELNRETAGVDQSNQALSTKTGVKEVKNSSLVGRLGSWINWEGNWTGVFGRGASVALVAVLAVFLVPMVFFNPSVDQLYEQYTASGIVILPDKSISFSNNRDMPYSSIETEFAKGLANGLEELQIIDPPASWTLNKELYADGYAKLERDDQSAFAFGRLVALSLVQCKVAKDDAFFKSAAPLMQKLMEKNDSIAPDAPVDEDTRADVCVKAAAMIDRF